MTSIAAAIGREPWEAALITELTNPSSGLHVARRCVDAIDVVAVALSGLVEVVVVGPRLPRLDRDLLEQIESSGTHVVGVHALHDDVNATRLRAFGIDHIVAIDASSAASSAQHLAALAGELRLSRQPLPMAESPQRAASNGHVTVVIGPTGAPGRSTVAMNVATHWSQRGLSTILIDADTDTPVLAAALGVLTDDSGLARAARTALEPVDDSLLLDRALTPIAAQLSLMSGSAAMVGSEAIRRPAIERVVSTAAQHVERVVIDTAAWTSARAQVHGSAEGQLLRTLIALADSLVVVGAADPIGLVRLLGLLSSLEFDAMQAQHVLILNQARASALGGAEADVARILAEHVPLPRHFVVPFDQGAADVAVLKGQALLSAAPKCKAAASLREVADYIGAGNAAARVERKQPNARPRFVSRPFSLRRAG